MAGERECRTCRSTHARANPRALYTSHTLGTSSARAARDQHLHAQEAPERQRPQVPDDLDRPLEIAVLDRGDVREIVVALRLRRRAASE